MKRILTLFLSIVMCIGMTACGSKPKNKYEEYVLSFVQDFQTQNFDAMYKLTSDQYPYFQGMYKPDEENNVKLFKAMAKNLKCEIVESSENGNEATVKAHITTLDFAKIMSNISSRLMVEYMTPGNSGKDMDKVFSGIIDDEIKHADKKESDTVFNFVKDKKGNWTLDSNVAIYDDICGGYLQYYFQQNTLGKYANEIKEKQQSETRTTGPSISMWPTFSSSWQQT